MLTKYLEAAMKHAHYEILKDEGGILRRDSRVPRGLRHCAHPGGVPQRVWLKCSRTGCSCIHKNLAIPKIDGLEVTVVKEVVG